MSFAEYIDLFGDNILFLLEQHIILFAIALTAAIVLGVTLGTLVHRFRGLGMLIVPIVNVLQACPEIVLLALSIPFLGIGISGALQHLAGIQSAKKIIAINADAQAPLMQLADLALVGDLFEIIPQLTAELERLGVSR